MKKLNLSLVIALAAITSIAVPVQASEDLYNSQVFAQSSMSRTNELQLATDELLNVLKKLEITPSSSESLLIERGRYAEVLASYFQKLQLEEKKPSEQDEHDFHVALAYTKLAYVAEQAQLFPLANQGLAEAERTLRKLTDVSIFSYFVYESIDIRLENFYARYINLHPYTLYFSLLQEIYNAQGRLAYVQGNSTLEQERQYQSLLSAERIRTLGVDVNIAFNAFGFADRKPIDDYESISSFYNNYQRDSRFRRNESDPRFRVGELPPEIAEAFSSKLTIEDIKAVASNEDATVVSYSIISNSDFSNVNVSDNASQVGEDVTTNSSMLETGEEPDKLLIWVIQPTGEIEFFEQELPSDFSSANLSLEDNINSEECEQNAYLLEDCRGEQGTVLAKLVRSTRSALGVRERGEQGTAIATRLVRGEEKEYSRSQQDEALRQLYDLLIAPIAGSLPSDENARVVFIPQDYLSFVPFAALKDPDENYLIQKHTILTAPNFRTLLLSYGNRRQQVSTGGDVVVVGNPTMPTVQFEVGSPRLLDELPSAQAEAEKINDLLKSSGQFDDVELFTGSIATEEEVTRRMRRAQIIHLATHGILDAGEDRTSNSEQDNESENQTVSSSVPIDPSIRIAGGAIALAPTAGRNNGFLTATDIFNMQLRADLVVLSACNTGQGPLTPGGVIGLPFAFSFAGVPSTVVSLWAVSDDSTAELMTRFYDYYLESPDDKAGALRRAMLDMINHENPEYHAPLHWAAFTLVGTSR